MTVHTRSAQTTGGMEQAPSFTMVFAEEGGYILHTLRRLGVRESDLEDLTQDVLVAVHRRLGEYDPTRPLRPWLFGFAFRAASNYRRLARHRREAVFEGVPLERAAAPAQEEALVDEERRRTLHRALDTLDLKHRAALVLVDLDGVPPAEVAQALDVPIDTVYSRVRNARKKLRAVLLSGDATQIGARHG